MLFKRNFVLPCTFSSHTLKETSDLPAELEGFPLLCKLGIQPQYRFDYGLWLFLKLAMFFLFLDLNGAYTGMFAL